MQAYISALFHSTGVFREQPLPLTAHPVTVMQPASCPDAQQCFLYLLCVTIVTYACSSRFSIQHLETLSLKYAIWTLASFTHGRTGVYRKREMFRDGKVSRMSYTGGKVSRCWISTFNVATWITPVKVSRLYCHMQNFPPRNISRLRYYRSPIKPLNSSLVCAICMVHTDTNSSLLHNRTSAPLCNRITEMH